MKLTAIFLAGAVAIGSIHGIDASARTVNGHTVPDTLHVANTQLILNGAGIRKKVVFDVYLAALYTGEKTDQAQALINSTAPRAMRLVLLRDVDSASLADALDEGLRDNTDERQWQAIQPSAKQFASLLLKQKSLKRGSVIDIVFSGSRVSVSAQGAQQGAVDDAAFARALLAVWLGQDPAQSSLKQALLGAN
ncbi:MAG: chalcone isomerase family protein [Advenella sp.]|uniref:chalcone isomerase family protein n=1 Tax=Advenella sp. S44 TaxID=1982755 RepID=UPI000C299D00|nr:chalcone isomerase family protein [Advenella sp. S44]